MSSTASTPCALASWTTNEPSSRAGRGPTTTSSSPATATRPSSLESSHPCGDFSFPPRHRGRLELHRRGRHRNVELVHATQQVPELEAPEHLLQLRAVGRLEHELGHVAVELEIAPHRRQLLGLPRLVGVLGDVLAARRRQLVRVLDHLLERAVLRDQLPGGLVADPGTPGMLSEVSPLRPMKSGTCSGRIP